MQLIWEWGQVNEEERGQAHPILLMALWQRDDENSRAAGRPIFKLPYPGGSWYTEKERNQNLLTLMDLAWRTATVSIKVKAGESLNKNEEKLLTQIAEII